MDFNRHRIGVYAIPCLLDLPLLALERCGALVINPQTAPAFCGFT